MNYGEAIAYIEKSYEKNNKKGFGVMREVLDILGNPHEKLKIIHVAGTNGKGSTCVYLTNILMQAGYRVGTFTSPHLIDYNERFSIDNEDISNGDLIRHIGYAKEATERVLGTGGAMMSFFEIFSVICFNYFFEKKVDFAIVEVGLGGKFDPTNVIEKPLLSIITSIGFDHMNILGESIEQIACEKAGIIKKNCPVVLYCNQKSVYNIFQSAAKDLNADFFYFNQCFETVIKNRSFTGTTYSAKIGLNLYEDIFIKLLGDYQVYNSTNVIFASEVLQVLGLNISEEHIRLGLAETEWECRMEIVRDNPLVLLDGAHNFDAARVLGKVCEDYFSDRKVYLIIGMLSDKEYEKITAYLSEQVYTVIYTMPESKRAIDANELLKFNKCSGTVYVENDYIKAFDLAKSLAYRNDVIIVAGSLYLAGSVRRYLTRDRGR